MEAPWGRELPVCPVPSTFWVLISMFNRQQELLEGRGNNSGRAFTKCKPHYKSISKCDPAPGPLHLPFSLPRMLSSQSSHLSLNTMCKATRLPVSKPQTPHPSACFVFSRTPLTTRLYISLLSGFLFHPTHHQDGRHLFSSKCPEH